MSNQPSKVFINSDHRQPTDSADSFTINLSDAIQAPKSILLRTATIPNTGYNIPAVESVFYYEEYDGENWISKSIAVNCKRAFLNPVQLVNQFNSDSTAQGHSLSMTFDPDSTSLSYNANAPNQCTYRAILRFPEGGSIRLPGWTTETDDAYGNKRSMYWNLNQRLGFTNRYTTEGFTERLADSPPNLQRTSCINIRCSLGTDTLTSNFNAPTQAGLRDVMLSVPCNSIFGDIVVFKEPSGTGRIIHNIVQYSRSITIQLLDDQFNPLGLPDNAISCFEFDFLY